MSLKPKSYMRSMKEGFDDDVCSKFLEVLDKHIDTMPLEDVKEIVEGFEDGGVKLPEADITIVEDYSKMKFDDIDGIKVPEITIRTEKQINEACGGSKAPLRQKLYYQLWIVTFKYPNNPKHNPRNKVYGDCVLSTECTDTTGSHHSALFDAIDIIELKALIKKRFSHTHITRIEKVNMVLS